MATFPAINPIYPAGKQSDTKRNKIPLGDGYESSLVFGLNAARPQWNLTWLVELEQAEQIKGFLQARSNAGEWFDWQPPDTALTLRWRCDEWNIEQQTYNSYRVTATFRRVFELLIPSLSAASAICESDILCEGDYGDIGSDLWVSRITSPFSTVDFQNPSNTGWAESHSVVSDSLGRSYTVWIAVPGPIESSYNLVITKRRPNGEIIWSKEIIGVVVNRIIKVLIADVGDGTESIVAFCQRYGSWSYDQIYIFSLGGDFRRGFNIYGIGATQARSDGMVYLPKNKHLAIMRHDAQTPTFDVIDPMTGAYIAGWYMNVQGSIYASGDIPSGNASLVEFDDKTSALCYSIGDNRILVVPLDEDYAPPVNVKQYLRPGSGCVATRYGDGFIMAGGSKIYEMTKDSELVRVMTHSEDIPCQLYVASDGVYMGGTRYARSVKFDLGLTTKLTSNYGAIFNTGGWVNGAGNNNADESLCIPVNRFVASCDTLQGYGASAPAGSALFQVLGIRASAVGGFTSLYTGGNTSTAQGYLRNSPLPTYLAADIPATDVRNSTLNLTNRFGAIGVGLFAATIVDATDKYKFTLYSTDLVG